jgi:hypothetical protein
MICTLLRIGRLAASDGHPEPGATRGAASGAANGAKWAGFSAR